jgi:hypothetical protein
MKQYNSSSGQQGSTLVVTLSVVAVVLVLVASAVGYTQQISKMAQRSRQSAVAMEIADGHLEALFTHWRNISRIQVQEVIKKKIVISVYALPTQYFFTAKYNPGPAPVPDPATTGLTAAPPIIPLPQRSEFPSEPGYVIDDYRIQAVKPTIELDANGTSTVPVNVEADACFGPNTSRSSGQYSYYYLASADVTVPTLAGNVTAKVRRVFEKKYDMPFNFAMFYVDDLEFHPSTPFTLTGPIQTNGNLYIGNSNFIAKPPTATNPTSGRVGFGNSYVNGPSPLDPFHPASSATAPTFAPGMPPSTQAPYLPFGWNVNLDASTTNNQNYHELIERPDPSAASDPIALVRFHNQADYRVLVDVNNNFTVTNKAGTTITSGADYAVIRDALEFNQVIIDPREGGAVRVVTVNIGDISKNSTLGMIYIADTSAGTSANVTLSGVTYTTTKRAVRLKNGRELKPAAGLTVVSENPVYIQGDYNVGACASPGPASNSGTYTSPLCTGYGWKPAAVVGDAITVLSNAWNDTTAAVSRVASNTTVNAALVTGNVPSNGTYYSGGGENFIRFLENWGGKSFTYYGSMVQLWQSKQGTGPWSNSSSVYTAPTNNNWFYDKNFEQFAPPGNFQIAAYLQQQRWYQVY